MSATAISLESAKFELMLLNSESSSAAFDDVVIEAAKRGIPPEIVTRLKVLWDQTRRMGTELIEVGKIVVRKIVEFLKAHPGFTWGTVIGAALGCLVVSVPFLGTLLASLITAVGAWTGVAVDAKVSPTDPVAVLKAAAEAFFALFASVIDAVAAYFRD